MCFDIYVLYVTKQCCSSSLSRKEALYTRISDGYLSASYACCKLVSPSAVAHSCLCLWTVMSRTHGEKKYKLTGLWLVILQQKKNMLKNKIQALPYLSLKL